MVDSVKKKGKRHRKDKRKRQTERGQRKIELSQLVSYLSKITLYNKYKSNLSDFTSEGKL